MNSLARSIVGAAVTAVAVYYLDPANGYERRILLQDRCKRAARRIDRGLRSERAARYFASRPGATLRPMSDKAVSKSVRGVVRHSVSHPRSIDVAVDRGHVILRGELLPYEHQRLLDEVRRQPGVAIVTDHLIEHSANGESAVDSGRAFVSARGVSGWGVTARVLAGCAGGALIFLGIRERKALGEIGTAIAEEVQRVMEQNLRHDFADDAADAVDEVKEGAADVASAAAKKVDEGMEWAESKSSEVIEEYAQKRRRAGGADATH
jgi:hypothetical protein